MRGRWLQGCDMGNAQESVAVGTRYSWREEKRGEMRKWRRVKMRRGGKKRVRTLRENYGNVKSKRESEPELQRVNGCMTQWGPTQSGTSILSATIAADWVGQGFAGLNTSQPHKAIERLAHVIWPLNASSLLWRWAHSGYSVSLPSRWTSGTTLPRCIKATLKDQKKAERLIQSRVVYIYANFIFFPSPLSHGDQLLGRCVIKHHGATGEQWPPLDLLFACFCFVSRRDLSSATSSLTHAFFQLSDSQRTS